MWLEIDKKGKKVAILSMVDESTRLMAARLITDEKPPTLSKAIERSWIRHYGPTQTLKVDEATGWGSDLKVSPGQVHNRTSIVERRHQLLRRALQIYLDDNQISGIDAIQEALAWVVPSLNQHTFVNGFTPVQLALGQQPNLPGLMSDERTTPVQLSEDAKLRKTLDCRAQAQQACAKADVDVKLRRAMLRHFRGQEADLAAGERCLYWRELSDRFHTIKWKGPAVTGCRSERS